MRKIVFLFAILLEPLHSAVAGGSGLNTVVVINQNSSNSVALANYYAELRQVPPQNVFRMTGWPGGRTDWSLQQFTNALVNPLRAFLAQRALTIQVDYLVLSMDIPYRVVDGVNINSTTSALYYGFKTNGPPPFVEGTASCSLPDETAAAYGGSEMPFRSVGPGRDSPMNFLTAMITGYTLDLARGSVFQGAIADCTFPTQTVYLAKSTDVARNVRYQTFDRAIFDTRLRGNYSMVRTNINAPSGFGPMLGLQTGYFTYSTAPLAFVPGALADNLTSYGGIIFQETGGHLNILSLLAAGATGTYGTVDEPCNYLEKFPTAQTYFYQARGFCLGESYYMGVTNPFQGLLLGDPLSAPFAAAPAIAWTDSAPGQVLAGEATLRIEAQSTNSQTPVARVDLYTNGAWMRTLTNIAPAAGNALSVNLGSRQINYTVPAGATVESVAEGLATALNNVTAQTRVKAAQRGDRIDLLLTDRGQAASGLAVSAQAAIGTAPGLTTHVFTARTNFLDTVAAGFRQFTIAGNTTNRWLNLEITKTNGSVVNVALTNAAPLSQTAFVEAFIDTINAHPDLSGPDGVVAQDHVAQGEDTFNLNPRSAGWGAAQLQARLTSQVGVNATPSTRVRLDENLEDLQPRNHLYVSAGVTNLSVTLGLDTRTLPDGPVNLMATAVDGTHVQVQRRALFEAFIRNTSLEASIATPYDATNVAIEAALPVTVTANDPGVSRIELFSTGGALAASMNTPSYTFDVDTTLLGPGLHPLYAVVTTSQGRSVRTATTYVRLVPRETGISVSMDASNGTPRLAWMAAAGRTYTVFATETLPSTFQAVATVVPTNNAATWTDPNPGTATRFYKISP